MKIHLTAISFPLAVALIATAPISSEVALARSSSNFKNAHFSFSAGYSTVKSEALESNDTAISVNYRLGLCGGRGKDMCMSAITETTAVTFALNTNTSTSTWQGYAFAYRMGPIYIGPLFSYEDWEVAKTDSETEVKTEYLTKASGFGGIFGARFPVGMNSLMVIEALASSPSAAIVKTDSDDESATITIGQRTNVDIGALVNLSEEVIDFAFGFKYQTFAIGLDGTTYAELMGSTYVGLAFDWDF